MNMPTSIPQPSQEVLINALAQARLLILEMGHVVRHLDEDNINLELWTQDGEYLVNERYKQIDALVPAELKTDAQDAAEDAPQDSSEERGPAFVVVQQGGSSLEVYIHSSSTREDAEAFRVECEEGAYQTSEIIEVPAALAAHGETFYEVLEAVAQAAIEFP